MENKLTYGEIVTRYHSLVEEVIGRLRVYDGDNEYVEAGKKALLHGYHKFDKTKHDNLDQHLFDTVYDRLRLMIEKM
ncbi:hypothetical protein [Thalassobacillus sp. CUG 92003]|uniref:hypothetical protein n=1 Tax=Thalassobacillus sp. CUG 92003 TaxID=2736641 RepID=UPI0015E78ECF|nr:hypothetical protein [Thalassobacillus sp. CUG 92003]